MYYLNGLGCGKSCPCEACRKAELAESLSGLGIPAPMQEQIGYREGSSTGPAFPGFEGEPRLKIGAVGTPEEFAARIEREISPPVTVTEKNALNNVISWNWNTSVGSSDWKGIPFPLPTATAEKKLSWFDSLSPEAVRSLATAVPMSAAVLQNLFKKRKKKKKVKFTPQPAGGGLSWTSFVLIGIGVVLVGGLAFGGYKKFKK
jgi:hypothetical protein